MPAFLNVARTIGVVLLCFALGIAVPGAWSWAVDDGAAGHFAWAGGLAFGAGLLLWAPGARRRRDLQPRDGCVVVVASALALAALGAVPIWRAVPGLSFGHAYFEALAGLTTTAASTLRGLDTLPPSINLWRHLMQWYGGLAIIVLSIAFLPRLGAGGPLPAGGEAAGAVGAGRGKQGRLTPRIRQTARNLWLIYAVLTLACVGSLRWAGMNWFDALCHGLSTLSLGGFSTRDGGIAAWQSPSVEAALTGFMLLAMLNFGTHFLAVRHRSVGPYVRDSELATGWLLLGVSALLLSAWLVGQGAQPGFAIAFRQAGFAVVSMASTAGFVAADWSGWPAFVAVGLLLLSALASSSGSTGGGIRAMRVLVLVRQAYQTLVAIAHPRAVRPMLISGRVVENHVVLAVLGYMLLYGATAVVLSFAMMASGLDLPSAMSAVVSCLNNAGPGLGVVAPGLGYHALTDLQLTLCGIAMLAGRLELLAVFALLTPQFWRK